MKTLYQNGVRLGLGIGLLSISACAPATVTPTVQVSAPICSVNLHVLGYGQDGAKPQMGRHEDIAFQDTSRAVMATSLGLIDQRNGARYLFDATPDIAQQSYDLALQSKDTAFRLDGIFLTHGHIGHYLGLAFLGRESMGASSVPVYAMPKMGRFLRENGPWSLLIGLGNIAVKPLADQQAVELGGGLSVTPLSVPHRGEFTETVGYRIKTAQSSALYLPDIDSWDEWAEVGGVEIADIVADYDILFLDATFFDGSELPGRDMRLIPHPTIAHSMERLAGLEASERAKVHFIHLNHTNPALRADSPQRAQISANGFNVAETGLEFCLETKRN